MNRINTTPTLIRCFWQKDNHRAPSDYSESMPTPEICLYTWEDATLFELTQIFLKYTKLENAKVLSFAVVHPNFDEGGYLVDEIGTVDLSSEEHETTSIQKLGVQPGFMFDIAYTE